MNPSLARGLERNSRLHDRTFLTETLDARPVRVGVIGVGSMGQNHVRVFSEVATLVGIADPDPKAALEDLFWSVLNSREFIFNH